MSPGHKEQFLRRSELVKFEQATYKFAMTDCGDDDLSGDTHMLGSFQKQQWCSPGGHDGRVGGALDWRPGGPGFQSRCGNLTRFGTLAIPFTLLRQCLSEEILKAVGPFYLVSMPGEVKDPTSLHWKGVTCRGLHILA